MHQCLKLIVLYGGGIVLLGCRESNEVKETYSNGKPKLEIISQTPLTGGKKIAIKEIRYHFNSNTKLDAELKNGIHHGKIKAWWINGHAKYTGHMKTGMRRGKWRFFFEQNGSLSSFGTYRDGKKNGAWEEFWPNGKKKSEGLYQNGGKTGRWVTRDSTGKLISDNTCFELNDSGTYISYYPGGREHKRYNCVSGKHHGVYTVKSPQGIILEKGQYNKSGAKEGTWVTRYNSNKISSSRIFKNGLLNDTARYWDTQGRLTGWGWFNQGTGTMYKLYPDSKLKISEEYLSGKKHGSHINYYKDGGIKSVMIYKDGLRVSYKRWYNSKNKKYGQLAVSGKHRNGKRHGTWKWYASTGKTAEICEYVNGKKHGTAKYFDQKTGELQRVQIFEDGAETRAVLAPGLKGK